MILPSFRGLAPRALVVPAWLLVFAGEGAAQQFQLQTGLLPGVVWSEGVEAADVDRDGDMDLFFANGEGFSAAGTKRQNTLLINRLVETSALSFLDESVARLGVHASNAKGVFTGDVDGDGWIDAMFANAFNTDRPFLYVNRGAAQPGFFDEEGSSRGFTTTSSSSSGQFGDVDDDGDLDVVLCDSGASFLGGAGGKQRLYLNDGAGSFTQVTGAAWNPPTKAAQMDIQFIDVDGDFDLDVFGTNRASNGGRPHTLMINDGTGSFSDASTSVPATSSSVYEAEVGDLDGDDDLDLFFVSLSGFDEGAMRNDTPIGGATNLVSQGSLAATFDDNEVALFDYDVDGDLDAFIASLDNREGLWRNNGGFSFVNAQTAIQAVSDSSLDGTVVDLDGDGRYDLVTAQGESNPGAWANKVYLNNGPVDTRAPLVLAIDAPSPRSGGASFVVHARVRDQVVDDGKSWVTARAAWVMSPAERSESIALGASAFAPTSLTVATGTTIVVSNTSGSAGSVALIAPGYDPTPVAIAPGASTEFAFVVAGSYVLEGPGGSFQAAVTVVGPHSEVDGLDQGGGQFRFELDGGPAVELCYELRFEDAAGNLTIVSASCVPAGGFDGRDFCFGDGGPVVGCTPCACGNEAPAGTVGGCLNGALSSARLVSTGLFSASGDTLAVRLTDANPITFAVLTSGSNRLPGSVASPCLGLDSGTASAVLDGLRCIGGMTLRHGSRATDANGATGIANAPWQNLVANGGFSAGQTRHFQAFYRENPALSCGTGQNTSQGLSFTVRP